MCNGNTIMYNNKIVFTLLAQHPPTPQQEQQYKFNYNKTQATKLWFQFPNTNTHGWNKSKFPIIQNIRGTRRGEEREGFEDFTGRDVCY